MYTIFDYAYNGLLYLNNILRPRHKILSQLMLYATTRCQSKCKHCSIWQKPQEHLSLDAIKLIMKSNCINSHTTIGLEGGEFILHPQADDILKWFSVNHPNYTLLSNGLAPQKVIDAVRQYKPRHLYLSLDGDINSYMYMRGVDGHDKVLQIVKELKDEIPISLMFCLTPWNSFKDMEYVINVAKRYNIDVRIGIYGTMAFFDTNADLIDIDDFTKKIPQNIHDTQENYDFVVLYDQWRKGNLKLKCQSILSNLVIHSNGDVPICQNLGVKLGNIHNNTLDEIFNSAKSCDIQCLHSQNCNNCWINFHRKYDIILLRNFEKLFPKYLIEKIYGKYNWTSDPKQTYRKHLKQ